MLLLALVAAVCAMPAVVHAGEENTFMQFAYIRDATVEASSVVHVVESTPACASMTSSAAAFDNACHTEAKAVCEAMGDDCGGFVIEPADVTDVDAPGISVKVYTPGARLFSLAGGVIFEYRGQVGDATSEEDELIAQHIDEQGLAEEIEAALSSNADIAEIEAAIKAFSKTKTRTRRSPTRKATHWCRGSRKSSARRCR